MRRLLIVTLALGLMVAVSSTAFAKGKPDAPGKPTTTTTIEPEYWTCQDRHDNGGTGWVLGRWEKDWWSEGSGAYVVDGVPVCIDIQEEHWDDQLTVVWSGETTKTTVKGLKLVFEQEVHGTVYDETVVSIQTGAWTAEFVQPATGNLVFVAMPHNGDKWKSFNLTVTPSTVTPNG